MILISNHLLKLKEFRKLSDVTIRINLAHVKNIAELKSFLDIKNDVFLDYPMNRTKPPTPTLNIEQVIEMIKDYPNVKYFAVSNVENPETVIYFKEKLSNNIEFVPKIETIKGVENLVNIINTGVVNYIMLDGEDLYSDTNNSNEEYLKLTKQVKNISKKNKISLLELHGVIFKSLEATPRTLPNGNPAKQESLICVKEEFQK